MAAFADPESSAPTMAKHGTEWHSTSLPDTAAPSRAPSISNGAEVDLDLDLKAGAGLDEDHRIPGADLEKQNQHASCIDPATNIVSWDGPDDSESPMNFLFGVSQEVMILGVSLYVAGFPCGPLWWGPLSEVYGRTQPLFLGFFLFAIFKIPVAVAPNVATIMISRFLGGCFGAAPIAIVGGTYVDF
ncbi:uncharacterized protein L3040_004999 [Drepanopeziza brunnea f. sp. 'multigermtubi']|uniref:uncharacterized protein n=1 Tax=Drepanopeziza brunnea f. sp. 'multigermtubi' TaxID=698441 RepID=UPI00238749E0|nr:hypothetical protein L3040_004999 [Drepanopeziza brunnea f. sp. 'multigermtubi']